MLRSRKAILTALSVAIALVIIVGAVAVSTVPQALQVTGYAGHLGEWELTASLAKNHSPRTRELSGPLTMKHVGLCIQDGPEERTGEMRLRLARLSSGVEVRLLIAGVECTYSGSLSDANAGVMTCPDRPAVPLVLWAK